MQVLCVPRIKGDESSKLGIFFSDDGLVLGHFTDKRFAARHFVDRHFTDRTFRQQKMRRQTFRRQPGNFADRQCPDKRYCDRYYTTVSLLESTTLRNYLRHYSANENNLGVLVT